MTRSAGHHVLRARRTLPFALVALGVTAAMVAAPSAPAAPAPGQTSLTVESFAGATTSDSGWFLPDRANNAACLTAGTQVAQLPIPACQASAIDAAGSGTLRLTSNANSQVGTVYNTTSLPTAKGLDIQFDTYQWNTAGTPADGINFVLAATDPANPSPPARTGPVGGSLGYSATGSSGGVSNGYLGFGLDVYGNYHSSTYGGPDCPASSSQSQTVTVRGPGNGTQGYCISNSTAVTPGTRLDYPGSATRPAAVPVEIALNATTSPLTTASGLTVPASSWLISWTPAGASTAQTMTAALPSAATLANYNFPAGSYDPTTGLPYQLTFGWAASTGALHEIHEIRALTATTLAGRVPVYDIGVQNADLLAGGSSNVTVTPSLRSGEGDEDQPATVTTTFPTGVAPGNPASADYACTTSGQTVSCTYTPSGTLTGGSSLPPLRIPVTTAAGTTGNQAVTTKVSSIDSNPVSTTNALPVTQFGATVGASSVAHGTPESLIATGLPSSATGTVTFTRTSNGAVLCTATLPQTSCDTATSLGAGNYPVTATYSGDGNYSTVTANTTFSVTKATATLSAGASDPSVPFGSSDTLTYSGLPADATGTVTFTDQNGNVLCTATRPVTSCATSSTKPAGSYQVTATYSGDANFNGVTAPTTSFSITPVGAPAFTAGVADASLPFGTADTLGYSGLTNAPTGAVTFTDQNGNLLCTATLPATSCPSATTLPAGSYAVTAHYSGDANHQPANSTTQFTVIKAPSAITVSGSAPTIGYGSAQTLTAGTLPSGASGTVTFTDQDGNVLCTATLPAASCQASATLPAGAYRVTATYSGDANHTGATATTSFEVVKNQTTLTATITDAAITYGATDTIGYAGLPADATGTVTFTDQRGATLCTTTLPDTACDTAATLAAGNYAVTASYSGDQKYQSSQATTSFSVAKQTSAISAGVADGSIAYGTPQTLTVSGLPTGATGTVTFTDASRNVLCTIKDVAVTQSCTTPTAPPVGTYGVTAVYSGDANHSGSTATTQFGVTKATTNLLAGVSDTTVTFGATDTLSVRGLPSGATGTVTFTDADGQVLCRLDVAAAASCTTPPGLGSGSYKVTATYSGDANTAGDTATTAFTVTKAPTEITGSGTATGATGNSEPTLTATDIPPGATGTVTFTEGDTVLCTATLPDRTCDVTTALSPGRHTIVATYSGDRNHAGSTDRFTLQIDAASSGRANHPLAGSGGAGNRAHPGTPAKTGSDLLAPLWIAGAMLVAGVTIVAVSKRRRPLR